MPCLVLSFLFFGFGTFVAAIIDFVLIAFVVFLIPKAFNKAHEKANAKKLEEEAAKKAAEEAAKANEPVPPTTEAPAETTVPPTTEAPDEITVPVTEAPTEVPTAAPTEVPTEAPYVAPEISIIMVGDMLMHTPVRRWSA